MSKFNKPSKSDKSSERSISKVVPPNSSTIEPQKLELVRIIGPDEKVTELQEPGVEPSESAAKSAVENVAEPQVSLGDDETADNDDDSVAEDTNQERLQPIPPATESMQYRAIGVIQGRYVPTEEMFSKGQVLAADGSVIDAVLLGKVISIAKKRLDLEKEYLWVVYPRTREKTGELHIQIAGVWAPVEMGKSEQPLDPGVDDGYFSIRGEVIFQSAEQNYIMVRVQRSEQKKEVDKARSKFKLRLTGLLPGNVVGYFWNINVQRQGNDLNITDAQSIASMPKSTRKPARKSDSKPQFKSKPQRRIDQSGQPVQLSSVPSVNKVVRPRLSVEKPSRPVKRPKPTSEA